MAFSTRQFGQALGGALAISVGREAAKMITERTEYGASSEAAATALVGAAAASMTSNPWLRLAAMGAASIGTDYAIAQIRGAADTNGTDGA